MKNSIIFRLPPCRVLYWSCSVRSSYVLRVDKCVSCCITLLFACLCMRVTFKSIAEVPLRRDSADHPTLHRVPLGPLR